MFKKDPNHIGFFQEAPNKNSSTRLFSFFVLIGLFYFDYLLQQGKNFDITPNFILMNLIGLTAVFFPKYLQKLAELKLGGAPESINKNTNIETEVKPEIKTV